MTEVMVWVKLALVHPPRNWGQSRRCNVDQGWLIVYTLTSVDRTSTNRKDVMSVPSQKRQGISYLDRQR